MAKAEEASSNLERVTDYVEEKELDTERMAQAMSGLESVGGSTGHTPKEEPPMPTVKPNKEFVAYIVDQLEISEKDAKSALRKHDNDLQRTIEHLITC